MGVIATSLLIVLATLLLSGLSWLAEPLLLPRGADRGPAAGGQWERNMQPANADAWMYPVGPVMTFLGIALAMIVIPFDRNLIAADLEIGVFYFLVVVDFVVLGLAVGGWGANTRNGVEVYYRATAQLVAYVIPLGLAYIGAIMMARSLSTVAIVEAQQNMWFVVLQPLGFVLYLVTGLMQALRAPFQEPLSGHIEHGVFSSYGGWKAVCWRLSMGGLLFVVSGMGAVLFLGGWLGPVLPGSVWMLLKTFAMMALLVWSGRRVRLRSMAETLELSWKYLTPIGLVNVLVVGGLILLGVGPS